MKRNLCYVVALGLALSLTSCGKKLGQFSADYFSVNPDPLEVQGGHVPARVSAKIPAKFFVKNAEVTVTPSLVYNGKETTSQSYTFQGEKVRGNNPVISYELGGTQTIPVDFVYNPEMAKSELMLNFTVNQGGKQYVLPAVKVANGCVATSDLAYAGGGKGNSASGVNPAVAANAFQRVINQKYAADIMFLINQANIRASQLKTDAMQELQKEIANANAAQNLELKEINIKSYASPDGGFKLNNALAQKRENTTKSYVEKQLKKDKITEFGELTAQFTAQDWEGFQKLVSQSNIQDKDLILSVLSMYRDPETREREIRNMSAVFEQLAETILPQLRYSRITASVDVIGKTDEEILNLVATDPSKLTVDEILYAATLVPDLNSKTKIYDTAARLYPNDYRTWNNLGMVQYEACDYDAAKANFTKAAALTSNREPQMNLGLVELVQGNYDKANQYFGAAGGVKELDNAMGVFYLKKGDVAAAVKAFGNEKNNNAALAQILAKDYSKAKNTLEAIKTPDATTYYLMAILGARTNNESMLTKNLREAARLDSKYAQRAATDLEFANYNIAL